jgi:hypothetical protein
MIEIKVDKASLNGVLKDLERYPKEKQKKIGEEIKYTLIRIRELAVRKLRSSLKKSKGRLESSIAYIFRGLGGVVYCGRKYGEYIEFGTIAHPIYPVKKKALAWGKTLGWIGDVPKKEFVRKRVYHPGTQKKPFMKPAAQRGIRELMVRLKKIL